MQRIVVPLKRRAGALAARQPLDPFARRLAASVLALLLLIWAGVGFDYQRLQKQNQNAALASVSGVVKAMEERVVRTVQTVDVVMRAVEQSIRLRAPRGEVAVVQDILQRTDPHFDELVTLSFNNAQGTGMANSNPAVPNGKSYADRDFFKFHVNNPNSQAFIGEPLVGPASGERLFIVSRRVTATDGQFLGVLVASVSSDALAAKFADQGISDRSSITLMHLPSKKILVRTPDYENTFGQRIDHGPIFDALAQSPNGSYEAISVVDGEHRIYLYRALPHTPFVLVAGLSTGQAAEQLQSDLRSYWVALLLLTLIIIVGAAVLLRSHRRQVEAQEDMELAALVYRNSTEAMLITDAQDRIIAVNPAFIKLTGYDAAEVIGQTPSLMNSGRHDAAFYNAIRETLACSGHWQGEMWDRRKNGEVYPKWITITNTAAQDGAALRRVALFHDMTDKKKSDELIWRQANFDMLTDLPNRQMFLDRLSQGIKKSRRSGLPLALLFLDLDRFKEINDSLGHAVGDQLLQEAARRLLLCVRASDTVARLGGDEFTVILAELEDVASVARIAQSILESIAEPFHLGSELVQLTASIGITCYPSDADTIENLLKHADQAMYAGKDQGRNRFAYFTPAMAEAAQGRMRMIADLRRALTQAQFMLYYQPIVDLATGHVHKAEALIRWQHPMRGMVNPIDFISIAEDTGMIVEIGDWVFKEAMRQVKTWRSEVAPDFQISVNKSPVQFLSHGSSHAPWVQHLQAMDLPGQCVVVEITEGLLMETVSEVDTHLLGLRDAGIQVSLDDFGTGYSSLSYLKKFDIDYLKIDRSFVKNLHDGAQDSALCEAIIVMAHKLGLKVIAEGVETEQQRQVLAQAGCDYAQGYLFSKPLPPLEFEAWLAHFQPKR